jgi:sugar lactone lactonase YvrE
MRHRTFQQKATVESVTRRSFLRLGALASAQASLGFFAVARAAPAEAPAPRFLLEWGKQGTEPGSFQFPIGIAITPADEVFVTDSKNKRMQQFSTEGKFISQFSVPGTRLGGIAIDKEGNLYVALEMQHKLCVYSPQGKLLREIGKDGTGDGELHYPNDIALAADGTLYVADSGNHRVQQYSLEGKFLAKWGGYGKEPGQFGGHTKPENSIGGPNCLAFDNQRHVYTTEGPGGRVQKLTAAGKPVLAWGDNEVGPGHFGGTFTGFKNRKVDLEGPVFVRMDKQDRVWVSAVCGRVQQFTAEGKFLRGFGEEGTKPGQFYAPHCMAFDSKGHLYVADAFNHRIQKFAV